MAFSTRNPLMQALLEQAQRLAPGAQPVLILGESGVGKARLARQMHHQSDRAGQPFVRIECTAVPEDQWEQELFGSARDGRVGKFELAAGGTLFLAELAALPPVAQGKLLQALRPPEEGTTRPAARILASTARDPGALISQGSLLPDLYHSFLHLFMPPLRERKEDLEPLTLEILEGLMDRGVAPPRLTADCIGALLLYGWPGNVRELEGALRRALLLAGSHGPIDTRHLPPEISGRLQPPPPRQLFKRYIKSAELLLIRWALNACGNDRTRTAKFLGLSRAALYKKLNLYPEFKHVPGEP